MHRFTSLFLSLSPTELQVLRLICADKSNAEIGAILGIRLGEEALPEFYIECLEPAEVLRELMH